MRKLFILMMCFGTALICSDSMAQQPASKDGQGGKKPAISPKLKAFLAAQDLDDVGDAREEIKTPLAAEDAAAVRSVIKQWDNPQAVSNLLNHASLIPEDVRLVSLFRGLAERKVPYYNLAAILGIQDIDVDKLSKKDRKRVAQELMAAIRKTSDVRAARACTLITEYVSENETPQLIALLEHTNDTVRQNLRAKLFPRYKDRGVDAYAAEVRKTGLAVAAQDRLISQFKDWHAKPTDIPTLFAYIPNFRDFKPSEEPGIADRATKTPGEK